MIIGVLGQSGSGKDTVADFLVKKYKFTKVALADPLKRICKEVYGFTDEQLWGPSEMRNAPDLRYPTGRGHLSPRVALQTLGTEWGREMYSNTWIEYGLRIADKVLERGLGRMGYDKTQGLIPPAWFYKTQGVVFSDIRFKNEVDKIRSKPGGFVIRIRRPGALGAVGVAGHASEEEQKTLTDSDFDYTINNTGTIKDLHTEVVRMLLRLPKGQSLKVVGGGDGNLLDDRTGP